MILYRLESRDEPSPCNSNVNKGVYRLRKDDDKTFGSSLDGGSGEENYNHPGLWTDMKLSKIVDTISWGDYIFCFATLQCLYNWFSDISLHQGLDEHLRIGIYQIEDQYMHVGSFQCIGLPEHMNLVEARSVYE